MARPLYGGQSGAPPRDRAQLAALVAMLTTSIREREELSYLEGPRADNTGYRVWQFMKRHGSNGSVDHLVDSESTKYGWIYIKQTQNDNLSLL